MEENEALSYGGVMHELTRYRVAALEVVGCRFLPAGAPETPKSQWANLAGGVQ